MLWSEERKRARSVKMMGSNNPMFGRSHSDDTKRKQSAAKAGRKHPMFGKRRSEETKRKIAAARMGMRPTLETRLKLSASHKGVRLSSNVKALLSKRWSGSGNPKWRGGVTPINDKIRKSDKYRRWRKKRMEKDDYTCQMCGKRGGKLVVDHIKSFTNFPKLRFRISNGRTLCRFPCHQKTPNYGWKAFNSRTV